ncbi:hypothetical protein BDP27DRAFT_768714 [Rhodocollybia butyracea]|uniref:Uncharacterized protein n=1 Tax=Rhodocollybia butyracea TaxID=206335 RepID=A0A9P5PST6_9AGAR|nr:hypothetical protein BDP27DRAFT_768714 [Rhodocollybia butyracea]
MYVYMTACSAHSPRHVQVHKQTGQISLSSLPCLALEEALTLHSNWKPTMPFPFDLILVFAPLFFWSPVRAVIPNINVPACNPQFALPVNSLGQSACQVAGYLGIVCAPTYSIPSILATQVYSNAIGLLDNNCTCSTVFYSALSACASCQGAGYLTWPAWSSNCSTVFDSVYPNPVPAGTAIPNWAFQSYSGADATFNVTLAAVQGDLPESVGPSSTLPIVSTVTGLGASGTSTPTPSSKGGSSKAGAIAGGVVGGLAFVSLLVVGAVFYRRRRRDNRFPGPILDGVDTMQTVPTPFVIPSSSPPPRVYDPSDPSTFPQSPLMQDTVSTAHYRSLSGSSVGYSGMAEI